MPQPLNWPTQAKPCLYGTWLWLVRKWQSREQSLWFPLWGRKHISELTFKIGGWQIGYSCSINYHFKVRDGFLHVDSVRIGISIHIFVSNGLVTITFFFFFFCISISISIVIVSCHWGSSWYESDQIAIERILVEWNSPCHVSFCANSSEFKKISYSKCFV